MTSEKDKQIVRELAKRYMELVTTEKQERMLSRMRDTNDLRATRPPVILDEIPWYQMDIDGELTCLCEDKTARKTEYGFRKRLYYMKHFKADNLFEPFFRIKRAYDSTGMGVDWKASDEKRTDSTNKIVSREYEDVLEDESALELMHDPVFTLRPDKDAERMEYYTELLGNSIPLRLTGFGFYYNSPWDKITRLRGVEPILMDMYDRPEYLHAIMDKFVSASKAELDFFEQNLEADIEQISMHCTPGVITRRADSGLKATWYRGMAQSFGVVSPSMFEEFEVSHILPLAERFGYTYYGCCEPLDDKIEKIKRIPNLRKIGCSPWANVERCAEQIGKDYVLSRKPNPAHVAIETDPEVIRREIEETVQICLKHGCPYDYVLKDISTVSNRPGNLIVWAKTVSDVLDKYYGEA
ncbi:MAG: hypothetical protein IKC26_07030 [Clostridia bacterium]|nr:hypothetical protein [Clostridia bacterium]